VLDFIQNLSLPGMFTVAIVLGLATAWVILAGVRLGVYSSGFDVREALPIKDALISSSSAMFALTMAFSAAGIWHDTLQARAAVQREAQALQNVIALADALPADLTADVKRSVLQYAQQVVGNDWPVMASKAEVDDHRFLASDRLLVGLIDHLAEQQAKAGSLQIFSQVLNQVFEARNARLARLTLAGAGISNAQWIALFTLFLCALTAVALVHNHDRPMQITTMNLYAVAAAAAFFVLLAHDRPFVGEISVSPTPLQQLAAQAQ